LKTFFIKSFYKKRCKTTQGCHFEIDIITLFGLVKVELGGTEGSHFMLQVLKGQNRTIAKVPRKKGRFSFSVASLAAFSALGLGAHQAQA